MFVKGDLIIQKAINLQKIKTQFRAYFFLQESIKYTGLSKINGNITHKRLGRNKAATTQLVMGSASLVTQISGDRMLVIN